MRGFVARGGWLRRLAAAHAHAKLDRCCSGVEPEEI